MPRDIGSGDKAASQMPPEKPKSRRRVHWVFPVGIGLAGLASAAAFVLRGCWHGNMSWPIKAEDEHGHFSYQVCNDCGIIRLFDEQAFRGFGAYGYDLHELIAHERLLRQQRIRRAEQRILAEGENSKRSTRNGTADGVAARVGRE
jgi:hypothetical protein